MTPANPAPIRKFPIRSDATPAFRRAMAIAVAFAVLMTLVLLDDVTPTSALLLVAAAGVAGWLAHRHATALVMLVAVAAPAALFVAAIVGLLVR